MPDTKIENEPHFIFLLTPPNSGSTAIAEVMRTSSNVSALGNNRQNGEGQWLIKALSAKNRWEKNLVVDEENLRTVWLAKCRDIQRASNINFFIEKSPPNMMRIDLLQKVFPIHTLIVNNRNPYANISSILYRYTVQDEIDAMTTKQRGEILKVITKKWLERSEILKDQALEKNTPIITYEAFCAEPMILQDILDRNISKGAIKLNFSSDLKIKDYPPQGVSNFNSHQIGKLTEADILVISDILNEHENLLSFFGYTLHAE